LAVAGPRARQVALGLNYAGKIVEARRRIGMSPAERLLADRQRAYRRTAAPSHCDSVNPPMPHSRCGECGVLKKISGSITGIFMLRYNLRCLNDNRSKDI